MADYVLVVTVYESEYMYVDNMCRGVYVRLTFYYKT